MTAKTRIKLTSMEREARRQKWQAAAIKRRRIRRDEDPAYAEQHRVQSRQWFREKYGVDPSSFRDCRSALDDLDSRGQLREVEGEVYLTFTVTELSKVLGDYHPHITRRWIASGQLPAPVLECEVMTTAGHPRMTEVYLEEEVRAIIEPLGEHQATNAYYRASHTETTDKINQAVAAVRQELGIE